MHLLSQHVPMEHGHLTVAELKPLIGRDDPTILEIGANVGQTTEDMLREMPRSRIYCFEPEPRAIKKFKERISSPNVSLFECAVGDRNGVVTFNQSTGEGAAKDWDQSGSIRKPKLHLQTWPTVKFETQIQVPIVRLDDWAIDKALGPIDLIWAEEHANVVLKDPTRGWWRVASDVRVHAIVAHHLGLITNELPSLAAALRTILERKEP